MEQKIDSILARTYEFRNNIKQAIKDAEKKIKKSPKDPLPLFQKLVTLNFAERYTETDQVFEDLAKLKPPVTDLPLLKALSTQAYHAQLGRKVRTVGSPPAVLQLWNGAVATCAGAQKAELLKAQFENAAEHGYWNDAPPIFAKLQKEFPDEPKYYFGQILYRHIASNKLRKTDVKLAELYDKLNRKQADAAITATSASPQSVQAIKSNREIRLLAQLYQDQQRNEDILTLLDDKALSSLTDPATDNGYISELRLRAYEEEQKYQEAFTFCKKLLADSIWDEWRIWQVYIRAASQIGESKCLEVAEDFTKKYRSTYMPLRNRQIIQVALHSRPEFYQGSDFLQILKDYSDRWMKLLSCFEDLRPALESLSWAEHERFLTWSSASVKSQRPRSDSHAFQRLDWLTRELNALKFEYHGRLSFGKRPTRRLLEEFAATCIQFFKVALQAGTDGTDEYEHCDQVCALAVTVLLRLHALQPHALLSAQSVRYLIQAAALVLHFRRLRPDNRTMAYLSILIFRKLGITSYALASLSQLRLKEFLFETLGHVFSTRIGIEHPFAVTTLPATSPEDLGDAAAAQKRRDPQAILEEHIDVSKRSVIRMRAFSGESLTRTEYDRVLEIVEMEENVEKSISKHICILEQRRIARLRGEKCDEADLDAIRTPLDLDELKDLREYNIFDFEDTRYREELKRNLHGPIPTKGWLAITVCIDGVASALNNEPALWSSCGMDWNTVFRQTVAEMSRESAELGTELAHAEILAPLIYLAISRLATLLATGRTDIPLSQGLESTTSSVEQLASDIAPVLSIAEHQRLQAPTAELLQTMFIHLELLQSLQRLCELATAAIAQKTHPIKGPITKSQIDKMRKTIQSFYQLIRKTASDWMNRLRNDGAEKLQGEVYAGVVGGAINELVKDGLEGRGGEMSMAGVNASAVEALEGVLRVKLA